MSTSKFGAVFLTFGGTAAGAALGYAINVRIHVVADIAIAVAVGATLTALVSRLLLDLRPPKNTTGVTSARLWGLLSLAALSAGLVAHFAIPEPTYSGYFAGMAIYCTTVRIFRPAFMDGERQTCADGPRGTSAFASPGTTSVPGRCAGAKKPALAGRVEDSDACR